MGRFGPSSSKGRRSEGQRSRAPSLRTGKEMRSSRMVDEVTNRGANHERDWCRDGGCGGRGRSAVERDRGDRGGGWMERDRGRQRWVQT